MNYNGFDLRMLMNIPIMSLFALYLLIVLRRRWKFWITILILAVGIALSFLCVAFIPYRLIVLREFIGIIVLYMLTFVVFTDKWFRKLFAVSSAYLCIMVLEILLSIVFPEMSVTPDWLDHIARPALFRFLLLYFFALCFLLAISARMFLRKASRFTSREWILFISFPFGQLIMLALWELSATQTGELGKAIGQLLAVVVSLASDTALYIAISGMSQRMELRAQNALLVKQIDIQKQHYVDLTEQYEKMRILRHDISNHVHTIQILLENGDMQSAKEYADDALQQNTFQSSLGTCENPIVDAFLYSRTEEARAQNIRMEIDVRLPYHIGIANTDLITVFGNLLDNALEACQNVSNGDKYIRLSAGVQGNYLAIRTENSTLPSQNSSRVQRIYGLERGLGSRILGDIAKLYHGAFECHAEESRFVATITLQRDGSQQ